MSDDEFCKRLIHEARSFGWLGDYLEVENFVRHVVTALGFPRPTDAELEPYEDDGSE